MGMPRPGERRSRAATALRIACAAGIAAAGLACHPFEDPPEAVAERFWRAVMEGDLDAARSHASAATRSRTDELAREFDVGPTVLGETLRNESRAIVETRTEAERGGASLSVSFDTHLVREDDGWRVDVRRTRSDLTRAAFAATVGELGETLGEGLRELRESIEQGALEASEALREALEDLELELPPPS